MADNTNNFDDLGAPAEDFSDLGAPSQPTKAAQPSANDREYQQALKGTTSPGTDFAQSFVYGAANPIRQANQARIQMINSGAPGFVKDIVQEQQQKLQEAVPVLNPQAPEATKSLAGAVGQTAGQNTDLLLNSVGALTGGLTVRALAPTVEKVLGLDVAEKAAQKAAVEAAMDFNKVAARDVSKQLYLHHIASNAVEGGLSGAGGTAGYEVAQGIQDKQSPSEIAVRGLKGAAGGFVLGTILGGGLGAATGRDLLNAADRIPEVTKITSTPLSQELQDNLDKLVLQQTALEEEALRVGNPKLPSEDLQAKISIRELQGIGKEEALAEKSNLKVAVLLDRTQQQVKAINDVNSRLEHITKTGQVPHSQALMEDLSARQSLAESKLQGLNQELEAVTSNVSQMAPEDFTKHYESLAPEILKTQDELTALKAEIQRGQRPATQEEMLGALDGVSNANVTKQEVLAKARAQVNEIQRVYQQKADELANRRSRLLSRLDPKAPDPELIAQNQEKLKVNLQKQVNLKKQIDDLHYTAYKYTGEAPQQAFSIGPTYQEMVDIAHGQAAKVNTALKEGLITESQAVKLRQKEFDNALALQGLTILDEEPSKMGSLLNQTTLANFRDKRLNTRTGEVVEKTIVAENALGNFKKETLPRFEAAASKLNKLGYNDDEITRVLQYVESDDAGNVTFNPSAYASEKLTRPPFQGFAPSPEAMQSFADLRSTFDELRLQAGETGKVQGYVPLRERSIPMGGGRASQSIADPTFKNSRETGELIPDFHETNIRVLAKRYVNEVGVNKFYAEPLREGIAELNKLRLMNKLQDAEDFEGFLTRALKLKDKKEAAAILGNDVVEFNKEALQSLAKAHPDKPGLMQELYAESNRLMYGSLVSTNPASMLKQALQPELILSAEIGPKYVALGRAAKLTDRALIKELKPLLKLSTVDDLAALEELGSNLPQSLAGKALRGLDATLLPFKKLYGSFETENRMVSLVGSYKQYQDAAKEGIAGLNRITRDLNVSERGLVRRVFQEEGNEAAAKMYAVIRTRRANFAYGIADKPAILNSQIGKAIPFTSFARNVVARVIEDTSNGNVQQLAKRVMYPLVGLYLFEQMTGRSIPGGHPLDAMAQVSNINIAPQVLQPIQTLNKTKSLKAAGENLMTYTPVGAFQKLKKQLGSPGGTLILPKVGTEKRTWMKQLAKDFKSIK